jgi:hypothetical protein
MSKKVDVIDKRKSSKQFSGEVCRVCGSRDVHSQAYGKPTMECIEYLRMVIKELSRTK